MSKTNLGVVGMSWKDLVPLVLVILGIILFLYGANYYDALTGWAGIFLVLLGIVVEVVLRIYTFQMKKRSD